MIAEKDPADHRGWYGLGQLYDILKMHTMALFYYQHAHKCRYIAGEVLREGVNWEESVREAAA